MKKIKVPSKILLYVIDALRYDMSRELWPYFNIVFTQHHTGHNWTLPAVTRMMTGMVDNGHIFLKKWDMEQACEELKGKLKAPTIGKYLKEAGYKTYGKTESLYVSKYFGFGMPEEWDFWHEEYVGDGSKLEKPEFLGKYKEFRFYHEYYLHDYFTDIEGVSVSETWEGGLANKVDVFSPKKPAEVINWEKAYIKRLKEVKKKLSWIPKSDALVIVTSDHGENLGEFYGDIGHTEQHMADEVARVPLLIHWPGVDPVRVSQFTRDIDLAPTILDIAGAKAKLDGVSLSSTIFNPTHHLGLTMTGKYVYHTGQLWQYYLSGGSKQIAFLEELPKASQGEDS